MRKRQVVAVAAGCRWWLVVALSLACAIGGWADEMLPIDSPPIDMNGSTMVPLRGIFEWLGAKVDSREGQITAVLVEGESQREIVLRTGSQKATANGEEITLDTPPVVRGGVTYVPLRFVGEALGATVGYDPASKKITIAKGEKKGYLLLPCEPIPATYSFDKYIALALRQEKLGDKASKAGQADTARRHYQTVLYATGGAFTRETTDNVWWASRVALREAYKAVMAGDYSSAEAYNQAARQLMAEALSGDHGSMKEQQASADRADRAETLEQRVKGKLANLR